MLTSTQNVYWCLVEGSELYLPQGELPYTSADALKIGTEHAVYIGRYKQKPCYWVQVSELDIELELTSLRELLQSDEATFLMASRAVQFGHMSQTLRFCGHCGGRNSLNHRDLAMQCGDCRTLHYPRIFPCVIVAVRKDDQILLAQHPRHKAGMYTVIAGFVEAGETLEQCVAREVKEETGIEVDNIQYFGSQPWAFPSSMMMAFTAEHAGGRLKPDYRELTDAAWFSVNDLPPVAPKGTIARQLIDATLKREA
ncbi:MAG: NAD(+) diphosphatase [Vibrio sp.]